MAKQKAAKIEQGASKFEVVGNVLKVGEAEIMLDELRPYFRTSAANKRQHLELSETEVLMRYADEFEQLKGKLARLERKGKSGSVKQFFTAPGDERLRVLVSIAGGAHDGDYLWVFEPKAA